MKNHWLSAFLMAGILSFTGMLTAAHAPVSTALKDGKGKAVGTATLTQTPNGVLIHVEFTGLTAGPHALHIHETGKCDAPDFKTAGGHFNPAKKHHGFLAAEGSHAGDMPNFEAPADGKVTVDSFNPNVTLEKGDNSLLKAGGTSIVVHAKKDDYKTDPAGDAGDRVACGVIGQ